MNKSIKKYVLCVLFCFWLPIGLYSQHKNNYKWPDIRKETKPWTRWWWMGNAVNTTDLSLLIKVYHKAGLGGLELTSIYGVKGYESEFINYLSPRWIDMLKHSIITANRFGMGIDVAQASGWPFGGPWVKPSDACKNITCRTYELSSGESLKEPILYKQLPLINVVGPQVDIKKLKDPVSDNTHLQDLGLEQVRFEKEIPLQTLMAYSEKGEILELTDKVDRYNKLNWTAPKGNWKLYALFQGWHGKLVERAGPGGEGDVIDHFSAQATRNYLLHFDKAFSGKNVSGIRAFFNDSYEVDDAQGQSNWTPEILNEFKNRRGYDLRNYLPALFGKDTEDLNRRVISDFRETFSDLLIANFNSIWQEWARMKKSIIRNQAHGSPGNLLDLYAASDIPETEGNNILDYKMASSAANVSGKILISSESATWENEHFMSNLAAIKKTVDRFFLGGVNHIFYSGTCYSPSCELWPGWLFYASVELNPNNSLWDHFHTLNNYVTRVQSFLQAGKSDNDILMYYPIYDSYSNIEEKMLLNFHSIKTDFPNTVFTENAELLLKRGYAYDFISDHQIKQLSVSDKLLRSNGTRYKTILFPKLSFIPLETLKHILMLADQGASIIFFKDLPTDVPGLGNLDKRRSDFKILLGKLKFTTDNYGIKKADVGKGSILLGDDLEQLLSTVKIQREKMIDQGLQTIRRKYLDGNSYFITNWSKNKINGWVPLSADFTDAAIFNPMSHESGAAKVKLNRSKENEIYLQLEPGESCIVQTYKKIVRGVGYSYFELAGKSENLKGLWTIEFIKGGPVLPQSIKTDTLKSWTSYGGEELRNFSGTARYLISFARPTRNATVWKIDLGLVGESAQIILNGEEVATLIGPFYSINIPQNKFRKSNTLEIRVSNLMANRIAEMDRKKVDWKKFYNINFIGLPKENQNIRSFDFSEKEVTPSGLLSTITLTPLTELNLR